MARTVEEILSEINLLKDSDDDKVWLHNFEEFKALLYSGARRIYLNKESAGRYLHEIQCGKFILVGCSKYKI